MRHLSATLALTSHCFGMPNANPRLGNVLFSEHVLPIVCDALAAASLSPEVITHSAEFHNSLGWLAELFDKCDKEDFEDILAIDASSPFLVACLSA